MESIRYLKASKTEQKEKRRDISSMSADVDRIAGAVRSRPRIKNSPNWLLNTDLQQNINRKRTRTTTENFLSFIGLLLTWLKGHHLQPIWN